LVLWLGWKQAPEFVDLDGDGDEEVIHAVPNPEQEKTAATAEIYKWNGMQYALIGTVPWASRFQPLK